MLELYPHMALHDQWILWNFKQLEIDQPTSDFQVKKRLHIGYLGEARVFPSKYYNMWLYGIVLLSYWWILNNTIQLVFY